MNIREIEKLTQGEAAAMALERMEIKGHDVYFVDLGEYFGYSAIVFYAGHHLYHANDYQLHHSTMDRDELREWYVETLGRKLFMECELREFSETHEEAVRKFEYIVNIHALKSCHVSGWHIGERTETEKELLEQLHCAPSVHAYYWDEDFARGIEELAKTVSENRRGMGDYDYAREAFLSSMWNHEYAINWQADWDVFNDFWSVSYGDDKGANEYLNDVKATPETRRAFWDARDEYMRKQDAV